MEWGDYVELKHAEDIKFGMQLLSEQAIRSLNGGLQQFDQSKPFQLGWYIRQGA